MDTTKARAGFAEAEVASLLDRAAYHKRQVWKHRKQLNDCMAEVERLRVAQAARLGLEVVTVPQLAQSQEAQSNDHHPRT
jgi:P2-related tail formation protein